MYFGSSVFTGGAAEERKRAREALYDAVLHNDESPMMHAEHPSLVVPVSTRGRHYLLKGQMCQRLLVGVQVI